MPRAPERLQARQSPLQPPLQHTPSTQKAEAHWEDAVQAAPSAFLLAQVPLSQMKPPLQSASSVQPWRQPLLPLHTAAPHSPAGSAPSGSAMQVPRLPATLHASQVPVQALPQHTPSTHRPEPHCPAALQAVPGANFATHAPPTQRNPAPHWLSTLHPDRQLPEPSQVLAPQSPAGSVPTGTGLQVPTFPEALQAKHPAPQALLQHTPSTHWPERHWVPCVQVCPRACAPVHAPSLQKLPGLQSASTPQVTMHAALPPAHSVRPQASSGSVRASRGVQVPSWPGRPQDSQPPAQAELQQKPSAQLPDLQSPGPLQCWPLSSLPTQALVPPSVATQRAPLLQSASTLHARMQPSVPLHSVRAHSPAGSVRVATGAQVPTLPATLHASQAPLHAVAQHTPSTQRLPRHSASCAHAWPFAFCPTHAPPTQAALALQSALEPHGEAQAPAPLHCERPHSDCGSSPAACGEQAPSRPARLHAWHVPLHAPSQHTPSTHCPEPHSPAPAQAAALDFFAVQLPCAQ